MCTTDIVVRSVTRKEQYGEKSEKFYTTSAKEPASLGMSCRVASVLVDTTFASDLRSSYISILYAVDGCARFIILL